MRPETQLLVGREDDQLVVSAQRGIWIETQKRVEDRERAFRYTEPWPRSADRAKDLPLVDHLSDGRAEAAICAATWASVSVRRPKGVVG